MEQDMDTRDMMLLERIKRVLEELEVECYDNGEGILYFETPQVGISFEVKEDGLDYRLRIRRRVTIEYIDDVLWYLNRANLTISPGHWELVKNYVYYRIHINRVLNKEVSDSRIRNTLQRGDAAAEKFYEGIMMICEEGFSGPEAFEEFVVKQSTGM